MNTKAAALFALADCCAAMAGNLHTLHLNVIGPDFDTMHKKVLKKYYEELDNDYDDAAEWGRCFKEYAPNKNESAIRIDASSIPAMPITRADAIVATGTCLSGVMEQMFQLFLVMNKASESCPICTGVANWLQTRLEYWSKEVAFFNTARGGVDEHIQ